jgi:hypothetical protein
MASRFTMRFFYFHGYKKQHQWRSVLHLSNVTPSWSKLYYFKIEPIHIYLIDNIKNILKNQIAIKVFKLISKIF